MTPTTPATKLTIPRRFSREGEDPLASVAFEQRRAAIYNSDGSVNFEMPDLEVPSAWDQTACDILASKYLRKTGVPQHDAEGRPLTDVDGNLVLGPERSARQWALRLANAWAIWGERGGYFAGPEDVSAFRDEMVCMLITQRGSPNSPQHFNTGLYEAYGIVGDPEGNWYYDETDGEVKLSPHRHFRSAASACYTQSVGDELVGENSIFDLAEREARLFKAGSGTGTNFSSLRAKGEKLSGGGTSSGAMSFLRVLDRAAGSIKSGGTTRRAAKLVALDCDHPEIEDFVNAKVLEEEKVAALIAGGFNPDWSAEGGAHDTVSFQNANHSVRIGTGFLDAVAENADWELTERTTGAVMRTIKARALWDQIAEAAWRCADPGVQFDDIINDWNTAANDGRLRATNPCCLAGETSVLTEEGWIPIATLAQLTKKGRGLPRVRTYDPAKGTFAWAGGTRAWKAGETTSLACVTTSGGLELLCTPDHHVLTADKSFVASGDLSVGRGLLGSRKPHQVAVITPLRPAIPTAVYDLEVPQTHTFVVGAPGLEVVVANSEYTHLDDTACNLASLNLVTFFDDQTGHFDVDAYLHAVRLWTIVLEISVSMAHYPSATLAKNSYKHRTLGLGYANLGALLMRAGLPYDSDEGRAVMGALTALLHDTAYATSSELAIAVGPCAAYGRNASPTEKVIRNHARAAYGSRLSESDLGAYEELHVVPVGIDHAALRRTCLHNLSNAVLQAAQKMLAGAQHGRRNMQVSCLAPTGTIGLAMSVDTTGVEPDFAIVKHKKLAGGGHIKIVNSSVAPALRALGYGEAQVASILTYALGSATLEGATAVNRQSLLQKGLPPAAIDKVEAELLRAITLDQAFAIHTVGLETLALLGIDTAEIDPSGSLLANLGFTSAEIAFSSVEICGHQTVEGSPQLAEEHLAVFDTANYCGEGTRVISWEGHVRALGAVAPNLSGSASKTVNVPNEATVDDIRSIYELAHVLGVKCVAVYRDGSKLSQVLTSQTKQPSNDGREASEVPTSSDVVRAAEVIVAEVDAHESTSGGVSPRAFYHGRTPPRFRLPDMRCGPVWKLVIGGTEVFLRTGQYPDGTLGELFIDLSKEGSTLKGVLSCFAIAISHGLQYGVPLEKFIDVFTFNTFEPRGVVAGHPNLKMCTSIVDAVFKVLAFHYLGRTDLVQIAEPLPLLVTMVSRPTHVDAASVMPAEEAHVAPPRPLATGDVCRNCGGPLVKSGTCSVCLNCAATTGCS